MTTLTAIGNIKDGKLILSNRKRFDADLSGFADCVVELTIKKKNRRSNQQSRYYFGVVVKEIQIRLKQLGNDFDTETIHNFLKDKFNKKELLGEGGEVIDYFGATTTGMNKTEFSEFVDKIRAWSLDFLSIDIPEPNAKLEMQF